MTIEEDKSQGVDSSSVIDSSNGTSIVGGFGAQFENKKPVNPQNLINKYINNGGVSDELLTQNNQVYLSISS